MLRHILLTRFNLATPGREARLRARPDWLAGRFELFERYCLPSVAAQTDRDFAWIIFYDDQTEDWARARIAEQQKVVPFHAVFTPMFPGRKWAAFTRLTIGPPQAGRTVVTSNLDSDDGLASDYVARVKRIVAETTLPRPYAINFENGLILHDGAGYWHRHLHNAFTNLVEDDTPAMRTSNSVDHVVLFDTVPVAQERGPPAWLQVIHGSNVSNKIRGRLLRQIDPRWFPPAVIGARRPVSLPRLLLENGLVLPLRTLRDRAIDLVRPIVRPLIEGR